MIVGCHSQVKKCLEDDVFQVLEKSGISWLVRERARVDKRVFWPQYFMKIEYVCLIGFRLT